ncbi:uncharacterized protein BP5553_02108 [Venustampulla echinocandica]|uniref:Uncharacterized protein n=1 Tax=Venustampulla echinocandica TaxID=2656787 RepID=A0A370U2X8_9HELO|nr:uncharacterized protein BP5553_02108 [Venustampulla echinocandica]RDL42129.1 hypothetical protein BP5553_02108 [Venustampulla echinocandica]
MPIPGLFGRAHAASDREVHRKMEYTKQSWLSWRSPSWYACYPTLDTLVCLCVGRRAIYMFERKRTLTLLQSLPDSTSTNEPDHDNQTWADRVGGDIVGEREPPRSLIQPWKEPVFGIKFRYRHSPQTSTSSIGSATPSISSRFGGRSDSSNSSVNSSTSVPHDTAVVAHQVNSPVPHNMSLTTQAAHQDLSGLDASSELPTMPNNHHPNRPCSIPENQRPASSVSSPPQVVLTRNGRPMISHETKVKQIEQTHTTKAVPKLNFAEGLQELGLPLMARRDITAEFKLCPSDTSNVSSYVSFPQFSQIWDGPQYHVTSMDPKDTVARWVKKNGLADKTALKPNMGRLHELRHADDEAIAVWYAGTRARVLKRRAARASSNKTAAQGVAVHDIPAQEDIINNIHVQSHAVNDVPVQRDTANNVPVQKEAVRRVTFQTEPINTSIMLTKAPPSRHAAPAKPAIGRKNTSGKQAINATTEWYRTKMANEANAAFEKAEAAKAHKAAAAVERSNAQQSPTDPAQVKPARNVYGPSRNPSTSAYQAEMARRANAAYEQTQAANGRPIAPAMQRTKARRRSPIIPTQPREAPKDELKMEPKEIPKPKSITLPSREVSRPLKLARPIRPSSPTHHELVMYERAVAQYMSSPTVPKKKVHEDLLKTLVVALAGEDEYNKLLPEPEPEPMQVREAKKTLNKKKSKRSSRKYEKEEGTDFSDLDLEPWIVEP